jgi:hypothetical protein
MRNCGDRGAAAASSTEVGGAVDDAVLFGAAAADPFETQADPFVTAIGLAEKVVSATC